MRTHTNEFKEELKVFGRQIKGKITYYPSYDLVSENDDNILTEADLQIISEQANYEEPIEINEEDIFSISIIKNGDLLQSLMKEFDFETKIELNIGSVVNPQFGLLVNGNYEYLNYGNYIINSKEFNMDTETWSYVCYDKMLFSMVKYRGLSNVQYPITIKQFINNLCNKVGLEFEDSEFVNQEQLIYEDLYKNRDVTYRDIFDEISKIVAGNLLINDNDKLEVGYPKQASYSENVTGSDISIEAVEEPISDVKLEGDTQQEGTPTPSNPQNIEVVTGEQNVIISHNEESQNYPINLGKNLFDKDNANIINGWFDTNTTNLTSNANARTLYIKCLPNTTYTITKLISYQFNVGCTNNLPSIGTIVQKVETGPIGNYDSNVKVNYTYTTNNTAQYLLVRYAYSTQVDLDLMISSIQIEKGNVATEYASYITPIELCKIGNYQDYIYNQNGDWYLHKEIGKIVLTGTENRERIGTNTINKYRFQVSNIIDNTTTDRNQKANFLCNMFNSISANDTYRRTEGISSRNPNVLGVYLYYEDVSEHTLNNFKNWLSNNNIILYYSLSETTDTQITDTNLIQQLDNLKNATLYNGVNNISVDGDLPSILNLDYISEYESINEDYLKDTNVRMSERIGVINSVAILDSDNNLQYIAEDTQSIKENEMTRVTITDNLIAMNGETQEIADNILNKLNGLYYYANDLQTTGVCYYDYLDLFNVEARGNIYQCLLLNNEITITQGIEEHIFTERFEEVETSSNEYTTSVISNKAVQFKINQQEGRIESKVEKDGVISAINQSAEEIQINADKLSLEGKNINLTGDNIKITGENLDIDSKGVITLTDNSAKTALTGETQEVAYIVASQATATPTGTRVDLQLTNKVIAGGIITTANVSYEDSGDAYTNGIQTSTFSQPRIILYSQSDDYSLSVGSYNDLSISLNGGISYTNIEDGVINTPLSITSNGNITCVRLTQTSKEENKKNFEKLTNAKDILNQVDIYKYNFKDEEDNTKKSIGFVIGDDFNYSQEITSTNNDGANIYSMVSVLWQVVKEQQEEIKELKEMIKNGKY